MILISQSTEMVSQLVKSKWGRGDFGGGQDIPRPACIGGTVMDPDSSKGMGQESIDTIHSNYSVQYE